MKRVSTCIVVADHRHARLFRNDGPGRGIQAVKELAFDTHLPRTRDLLTDGAGRGASLYDGRRHGMEGNGDAHRQEGRAFIADVAATVGKQMAAREYDRLILIAPPRALGELGVATGTRPRTSNRRVAAGPDQGNAGQDPKSSL